MCPEQHFCTCEAQSRSTKPIFNCDKRNAYVLEQYVCFVLTWRFRKKDVGGVWPFYRQSRDTYVTAHFLILRTKPNTWTHRSCLCRWRCGSQGGEGHGGWEASKISHFSFSGHLRWKFRKKDAYRLGLLPKTYVRIRDTSTWSERRPSSVAPVFVPHSFSMGPYVRIYSFCKYLHIM